MILGLLIGYLLYYVASLLALGFFATMGAR